jgi:hypothetical protein
VSEVGTAQRENAVPEVSYFTDIYTITSGMTFTVRHGLPRAPRRVWLELVNKVAEFQYVPDDVVNVGIQGAGTSTAIGSWYNSTIIGIGLVALPNVPDTVTDNPNVDSNTITAANWNLVIKAEV